MGETCNFPKTFQIEICSKLQSLVLVAFTVFELLKVFRAAGKSDPPPGA